MKQFAIYTACIGGYDNIVQPVEIDERFDYILFADNVKKERIGVWQVRKVDYTNQDKTRIARYVKTHPEELLSDYAATLWLDSNIQVISSKVYERFVELFKNNIDIASIKHPERNNIYEEAFKVVELKLEHDKMIFCWCSKLRGDAYPTTDGLFETNVLFRMNSTIVHSVDKLWWQCINQYSKRDQLSFNYVIWKYKARTAYYLPEGEDARNTEVFRYSVHSKKRTEVNHGFFEHVRWWNNYKEPSSRAWAQRRYFRLYAWHCAPRALYLSTIYDILCGIVGFPKYVIRERNKKRNV